jgi:hypothetical protein
MTMNHREAVTAGITQITGPRSRNRTRRIVAAIHIAQRNTTPYRGTMRPAKR